MPAPRPLGPDDDLPGLPRRILVAGASGAGKTTLAERIAARTGIRHQEIDALFHGPGWVRRPEFEADVDAFTSGEAWVTEWQYDRVRERLAARADLFVWLDLPRATVLRRVTGRTISRRVRRSELWNGNREAPLRTIFTDPDHIIRWSWRTHPLLAEQVAAAAAANPETLRIVRLRRPAEVERWLRGPFERALAG
ncbi:AAA family ATPase [Agromyces seonyuensis]|uniref:AAA family ATPase n=1 Tax=Agromyces seonyuensis TaxID=2662446 RepID=A0A6I4P629_9MICO|nr:AAA family ATPase [Agromyces seonyuensis]MWB99969.1 AAA family ATPase [Agromyces seonyuensis]